MQDKYKELIKIIRINKTIDDYSKEILTNYIEEIRDEKRKNDFFEFDFLKEVVLKLINDNLEEELESKFDKIINDVKFLLPLGTKSDNYEFYKELIINSDLVFDKELFSLFENKLDYQQILNIIKSKNLDDEQYNIVSNYIKEVSPYCISNEHLKKEVISFISGLTSQINYDEYYKEKIKKIEKRNGIYDIDEKKLSLTSMEVEKATYLINKLEEMSRSISEYEKMIKELTTSGSSNIKNLTKEELGKISNMCKDSRIKLINILNEKVKELEETLKLSVDELFESILRETQVKMDELNKRAQNITVIANTDLIKLQRASDDYIEKIKNYINSEEVKEALNKIEQSEQAINNLAKINTIKVVDEEIKPKEEKQEVEEIKVEVPKISEYHKKVFPTIELLGVKAPLIASFDTKEPARIRYERLIALKLQRKQNGELFHEAFDEVLKCMLQGDFTYLYGPSGCGKSYLAKQVATILGLEYNISDQVADQYGIKGYKNAQGDFQATQSYDAFVKGKMLIVNEFDNSNSQAQVVLNTLYDALRDVRNNPYTDSYVTFADDVTVPVNPNFRILCTGNTDLNGPNKVFQRTKSDGAVEKRVKFIELSYDKNIEDEVLRDYPIWSSFIKNYRKICEDYSHNNLRMNIVVGDIASRNTFDIAESLKLGIKTEDEIISQEFIRNKDIEYLNYLVSALSSKYGFENENVEKETIKDEKTLAKRLVYNINKKLGK